MISPHPEFETVQDLKDYILTFATYEEIQHEKYIFVKGFWIPIDRIFISLPNSATDQEIEQQPIK